MKWSGREIGGSTNPWARKRCGGLLERERDQMTIAKDPAKEGKEEDEI